MTHGLRAKELFARLASRWLSEDPKFELEQLYNISLKGKSRKLSSNKFLKENIRRILKEVSEYFVDNPNNFTILCNLLDLDGDGKSDLKIDIVTKEVYKVWIESMD